MNNYQFGEAAAKPVDITVEICGSAGDGSIAVGQILNLAMTLVGYHVMNFDSYPAEIRGFGKSVAHTRMSSQPLFLTGSKVDCLVALNDPHTITSLGSLKADGVIIYDSKPMDYVEEDQAIAGFVEPGMVGYGVPLGELSVLAVNSSKSRNIVAVGAMAGIFRIPAEPFRQAIGKRFGRKDPVMVANNIRAFELGYSYGAEKLEKADAIDFGLRTFPAVEGTIIVSGNEAVARACLDAGIKLFAGYPITPATRIMEMLARELPKRGGAVVQTEDEISAIGHVLGAGFAGARSATATSGPGVCLMVEMLNLAMMAEVPAVLIDSQRAGPSTGMPTKTEQSDLNLAIFGGAGDSPRPVLAPANVQECYELTWLAFEVAEAYQTPVIVLLDFFLSNRMEDVPWQHLDRQRFGTFSRSLAEPGTQDYQRYASTATGISPMALPGMAGTLFTAAGLEQNSHGLPDYTAPNHQRMTRKRQLKMENLLASWSAPEVIGEGELEVGIFSWGSSVGSAKEAITLLAAQGVKAGGCFPRLMWPLQTAEFQAFAARCRHLLVVEMNASGQFANLVELAVKRDLCRLSRVYAAPFPSAEIVEMAAGMAGVAAS